MRPTAKQAVIGASIVLALVLLGFGFFSWLQEHDARLQLQATVQAQQTVIDKADTHIKQTEAQRATESDAIQKQLDGIKTTVQATAALNRWVPFTTPVTPAAPAKDAAGKEVPNAPSATYLDDRQMKELSVFAGKCQQCGIDLKAALADKEDLQTKLDATQKKLDAATTAVKGGTKWQRMKRGLKTFGLGVLTGMAADEALHRGR